MENMKSLPTIVRDPYVTERENNDSQITKIFAQLFPTVSVPYEYIFELVTMLDSTKVNAKILPEVIRGIYNLNTSDRRGQVIVHVQKDLTNVQVRENSEVMPTLMTEEESS